MAIERGVDDVDIDELDIDDNSKEILVSATPEEGGMFDEVEEGDEVLLDDGTMSPSLFLTILSLSPVLPPAAYILDIFFIMTGTCV